MSKALVTGATSGVGHAIAIELARQGHQVMALGRNAEVLARLRHDHGITPVAADLTDREAVHQALDAVEIDILVNNAGMMPPLGAFQDADPVDTERAITINFSAQVALTHLIVPGMCRRGHGHVFFTGSTAGHTAVAKMAVYCATKAAIGSFAQALRLDVADHGVRVTEIVAGRIETNLYRDILPEDTRAAMYAGHSAVQPENVAEMINAVLAMPATVDVSRFDIVPTRKVAAAGQQK
ncbi:SDR family oxidoreductase [Halomonas sp. NCCP-2165]|nr:SDR family oxidoreductase [Halomonas sp. NCCP-2165]GKW48739.1 short-chain dehydrogenase [Halomonas sp. NCCP-2165]